MSSNSNDINNIIHTGNYEEFFILYMDNELTQEHRKMVESFLDSHPELRVELDLLLSTQLPAETVSFDKGSLLSSSMKLSTAEEKLLLYIDNELPGSEKNRLELELSSSKDYERQYSILLKTKLDAAEFIPYPNKEELYHHSTRVIAFKFYLRIAAAVLLVAGMGSLYFLQNGNKPAVDLPVAVVSKPSGPPVIIKNSEQATTSRDSEPVITNPLEIAGTGSKEKPVTEKINDNRNFENNPIAYVADPTPEQIIETVNGQAGKPLERSTAAILVNNGTQDPAASFDPSKQIINNS